MRDFLKLPFVFSSVIRQLMSPERHYGSAVVTLSFLCAAVALWLVSVVSQAKHCLFACFLNQFCLFFLFICFPQVCVKGRGGDRECELLWKFALGCSRRSRRLFRVLSRLQVEAS